MSFTQEHKAEYILLTEAGFIAVNQMDEEGAKKLFQAAQVLNPENTLPGVGFAYLHLHKLELKQACSALHKVLAKEPGNEMAKALLGFCTGLMPQEVEKGEEILSEMTNSKDPQIKALSESAIDFLDTFVAKDRGPAAPPKKKRHS